MTTRARDLHDQLWCWLNWSCSTECLLSWVKFGIMEFFSKNTVLWRHRMTFKVLVRLIGFFYQGENSETKPYCHVATFEHVENWILICRAVLWQF